MGVAEEVVGAVGPCSHYGPHRAALERDDATVARRIHGSGQRSDAIAAGRQQGIDLDLPQPAIP